MRKGAADDRPRSAVVIVAVIMARRPRLMIVVTTAVVALAQAMDMVCTLPRLRELVDHILLDRGIARHGGRSQHAAAHGGMGPRIAAKRAQRGVDSEADHRGNRRLRQKHLRQKARIHALGHEQGSISSEVERNTATSVPSVMTRPA